MLGGAVGLAGLAGFVERSQSYYGGPLPTTAETMIGGLRNQVPTRGETRAILRTVRNRSALSHWIPDDRAGGTPPDPELVDLIADPFDSVSAVHDRLRDVEAYLRSEADRRSVFLTVYTAMTARVEAGIDSGVFDDPEWVRAYLVAFGNRYRVALLNAERADHADVPMPWTIAFHATSTGDTLLLQDALLGINAHINYDLAYALRDVGIDPNRASKLRDHNRINQILHALIDVIQRALAAVYDARGYRDIDTILGSFDEDVTIVGLRESRSLAWRNAVVLSDARVGVVRRFARWRIRVVSTGSALFILAPATDPALRQRLRQIERGTPPIEPFTTAFHDQLADYAIPMDALG